MLVETWQFFTPDFNTILIDVLNYSSHMYTCVNVVNKAKRQLDTNYFKWSEHFLPLHKAMFMCITQLSFKFRGSQGKVACGITANILSSPAILTSTNLLSIWSRLCLQITYVRNKTSTCTFPL